MTDLDECDNLYCSCRRLDVKGTVDLTEEGWARVETEYGELFDYPDKDGRFEDGDEVEITVSKSVPVTADDLDRKQNNKI